MSEMKKNVGYRAVDNYVKSGMRLGMGTGSTAMFAVERLAQKIRLGELRDVLVVPTSFQTEIALQKNGLPVYSLNSPEINGCLDLAIDGADEVDPQLNLIKGGGAAHLIEKIVASSADQFIVICDESKLVPHMGTSFPLPLEIHPVARQFVINRLQKFGATVTLREGSGKMGPVISDSGNLIGDAVFSNPVDPVSLDLELNKIPGLIEHGLFTDMTKCVLVGYKDGKVDTITK